MKDWPFLLPLLIALLTLSGLALGQTWAFDLVFVAIAAVIVLDLLVPSCTLHHADERTASFVPRSLALWLPAYAAIVGCGVQAVASDSLGAFEMLRATLSVGLTGGLLAGPAAHELMHRRSRFERAVAEVLLALSCYTHFSIEHLNGHHRNVAMPHDPASARCGETVYAFYRRALLGGWRNAWQNEARRCRRHGQRVVGPDNALLRGILWSAAIGAAITAFAGWRGLLFFAAQGAIAALSLETINYVQHYGLRRRLGPTGRYEPPGPMDAWNAEAPVGNWFLLNLGRHSDHHCRSRESFTRLECIDRVPSLPTGLFGMCMLALLPPLWFRVMDPLVDAGRGPGA